MAPTRRTVLGATAATFTLAGCTSAGGGGAGGGVTDAPDVGGGASTPTPGDGGGDGPTLDVREDPDLGEYLVGPDDMTLYMFDKDERGEMESYCTTYPGACGE